jgi:hypothetical protein
MKEERMKEERMIGGETTNKQQLANLHKPSFL